MIKPTQVNQLQRIADGIDDFLKANGVPRGGEQAAPTPMPTLADPMETPTETIVPPGPATGDTIPAESAPAGTPTLDDARECLREMVAEKGEDAAVALLASFDAGMLSDVDPARFAGLMEKAATWPMPKAPEGPSGDEIKTVMAELIAGDRKAELSTLIKKFDAVSFSELKVEDYAAFHEQIVKLRDTPAAGASLLG